MTKLSETKEKFYEKVDALYEENEIQSIGQPPEWQMVRFAMPFGGSYDICAGPYRDKPVVYPGVKLAAELDDPCAIELPIKDFGVPDKKACERAIYATMVLMWQGATPYVGCMGGKGRTGVFLGVMAKVSLRSTRSVWRLTYPDPVDWIREVYRPEAIETVEQERYVRTFNTRRLEHLAKALGNDL